VKGTDRHKKDIGQGGEKEESQREHDRTKSDFS